MSDPILTAAASACQQAQSCGPLPAKPINILEEAMGIGWMQQQLLDETREAAWTAANLAEMQRLATLLAASSLRLQVAVEMLKVEKLKVEGSNPQPSKPSTRNLQNTQPSKHATRNLSTFNLPTRNVKP